MQALRLVILIPLLATSTPTEESALSTATLDAEDACAPGASEPECEISFRQLRGERTIARHRRDGIQSPLVLSSSVTEDYQYKHTSEFSVKAFEAGAGLFNTYTETPERAKWEFQSVVISLDTQPQLFESIDETKALGLRIGISSTLTGLVDAKVTVRVARLDDWVPEKLTGGKPAESLMPYYRMAAPGCSGKSDCYSRQPPGGFAKAPKLSTGLPVAEILGFNLTGVLDASHSSVQVFVTPNSVTQDGLWKTAVYKIQTWRFFNLADSWDDPSSSSGDDWGDMY